MEESLVRGTKVRVVGLVKAAQHNGKIGRVAKPAGPGPDGRVGVQLGKGQVLAVKRANLEVVTEEVAPPPKKQDVKKEEPNDFEEKTRTLKRVNQLMLEFDGSRDPNLLALYYHFNDQAFDCFNVPEYTAQMERYYANDISVVAVLPRRIKDNEYFLVCLQDKITERNNLCEVAFQCMRQFAGISMLVKRVCFVCNRPGAPMCKCHCACFCSKECETRGQASHAKLCRLAQASNVTVEDEIVQVL